MPRPRNRFFRFSFCGALAAGLAIAACEVPTASSSRFLGEWKDVESGVDLVLLKLMPSGSCEMRDSNQEFHYCRWSTGHDERIVIRFGFFLPLNSAKAAVTGDEMSLGFGNAGRPWLLYRVGSPKEQDYAAYLRGEALANSGKHEQAVVEWTRAADHGHAGAQNSLAWLYATAKAPELRDSKKAVAYAEKATATLHHFMYLDTLAASLARDQQFDRAVAIEEEALALLEKDQSWPDHEAVLTRFKNRLVLYKAGQPYTEP
jgi:tetratricopeptide (TPR) repeat protein